MALGWVLCPRCSHLDTPADMQAEDSCMRCDSVRLRFVKDTCRKDPPISFDIFGRKFCITIFSFPDVIS